MESEKHKDKQKISQEESKTDIKVSGGSGLQRLWNPSKLIMLHCLYTAEKAYSLAR